jgi:3',5'-cyclic AMP phosphodiesterase CpdA
MPLRRLPMLALMLALAAAPAAAETVSGRVYLDANSSGTFDEGDKPLEGVWLTDGQKFVRTSDAGRYAIDATADPAFAPHARATVTLAWPDGTWPAGEWFRRVDGVADASAVDFPLKVLETKPPFVFVHATDPHVPRGGKEKMIGFRQDMTALAPQAAFTIITGDLVDLSDSHPAAQGKAEYAFLAEQTKDFPTPLFMIAGNHDAAGVSEHKYADKSKPLPPPTWKTDDTQYGYGAYGDIVGPLRWSFNRGGVHFVGVDFTHRDEKGAWVWGIPAQAVRWLDEDLKHAPKGARVFLFCHFAQAQDQPAFEKVLAARKVERAFAGHSHTDRLLKVAGVPVLLGGSLSQVFDDRDRKTGYRLVRVEAKGIETFYRATGEPHAIAVDYPRHRAPPKGSKEPYAGDTLRPGQAVRGAFYDPAGTIKTLTVNVAGAAAQGEFTRGPLACRFEVKPDLAAVAAGVQTLEVTVSDGSQSWTHTQQVRVEKP